MACGANPPARRARSAHLARRLGVPHRIVRWNGRKPATGLQQGAREARYRLLAAAAARAKARTILTAHTLDDQAETVLIRMTRGSGLSGLGAMAREAPLPVGGEVVLVRPLLDIPKARLIATLERAGIEFADDPSNRDPRFTRARLREVMPALAARGARRAPAGAAGAAAAARGGRDRGRGRRRDGGGVASCRGRIAARSCSMPNNSRLPAEVALRLLGRAIARTGDEGPVQLGKLETLYEALRMDSAGKTRALAPHPGGSAGHPERDASLRSSGRRPARTGRGARPALTKRAHGWRAPAPKAARTAVER